MKRRKDSEIDFLQDTFPEQRDFINDTNTLVAALCTRRAAKSYSCGLKLFKACIDNPGTQSLFIAKSRDSAERILWHEVIKPIKEKYNVPCTLKYGRLTVEFENGSRFSLVGVDKDEEEMKKLLGGKFKLVIIDEASEYRVDVRNLVYKILMAAIADLEGQIYAVGTPADMQRGLFYEITKESRRIESIQGWSVHSWDTYANPYMARQWDKLIKEMIKANPRIVETPAFRQHYRKEWVIDTENLCYKYNTDCNIFDIPVMPREATIRILGIDLGWNDETSFVVGEYYLHEKYMVFRLADKKEKMILEDVGERIKSLNKEYEFDHIVIDGANKQFVQSLIERIKLGIISADKTEKNNYIRLMNSDFSTGKIRVINKDCVKLITEWQQLLWKEMPSGDKKEDPKLPNHCTDAALYTWRFCYHHFGQAKKPRETEEEKMMRQDLAENAQMKYANDANSHHYNDIPHIDIEDYDYGFG